MMKGQPCKLFSYLGAFLIMYKASKLHQEAMMGWDQNNVSLFGCTAKGTLTMRKNLYVIFVKYGTFHLTMSALLVYFRPLGFTS